MIDMSPVHKFMAGNSRNEWLFVGRYEVYVRKARHVIDGKVVETLDLANVISRSDVYAGFWKIYSELCIVGKAAGFDYLYLENTHNKRLYKAYVSRGCIPIPGPNNCLYKKL